MTTTEKLQRIRSKCVELLEIAEKRTRGKWGTDGHEVVGIEQRPICNVSWTVHREGNAAFITACAGPAEAAWKSTIAAIDGLTAILKLGPGVTDYSVAQHTATHIISAWSDELL